MTGLPESKVGMFTQSLYDEAAKPKVPIQFQVRVELGNGEDLPTSEIFQQVNGVLGSIKDDLRMY
jgi:hypothetical protein